MSRFRMLFEFPMVDLVALPSKCFLYTACRRSNEVATAGNYGAPGRIFGLRKTQLKNQTLLHKHDIMNSSILFKVALHVVFGSLDIYFNYNIHIFVLKVLKRQIQSSHQIQFTSKNKRDKNMRATKIDTSNVQGESIININLFNTLLYKPYIGVHSS